MAKRKKVSIIESTVINPTTNFLRRISMGAFGGPPKNVSIDLTHAVPRPNHRASTAMAMKKRRMSMAMNVDNVAMDFARKASIAPPAMRTGPNPDALPEQHIVGPKGKKHVASVIVLHGFTCNGKMLAGELLPQLKDRLDTKHFNGIKWVFLTAPKRNVSCYEGNPSENAWHDYFSDHGGEEGRPDIEEEIDVGQLKWSAAQVHSAIDAEAALFGGDYGRVGVIGQSQGSCTALYSVLTHKDLVAGVFCSIGQLYSHAPVPPEKKDLQFYSFNGAADDCIACCLSLRTYSRLLEAGYKHVRMHVEPHVGHEGSTDAEADLVAEALESWGLLGPP